MSDRYRDTDPERRSIPPIVWTFMAILVVGLFVLILGVLHPTA